MTEVCLSNVLSVYVVAFVEKIPDDFDLDYHWSTGIWEEEDDLLVVLCEDKEKRNQLVEDLKKMPWVKRVTLWAGGDPKYSETVDEIYWMCGDFVYDVRGEYGEICLLDHSESLVKELEAEQE